MQGLCTCIESFQRSESPADLPAPCLLPRCLNRPRGISEGNTTHHGSWGVSSLCGINPVRRNLRATPNRGTPHHSPCSSSGHRLPSQVWGGLAWGRNGAHPTRTGSAGIEQDSCSLSSHLFLEESNSSLRWRDSPASPVSPHRSWAAPGHLLPSSDAFASPNASGQNFIWSRTFCT